MRHPGQVLLLDHGQVVELTAEEASLRRPVYGPPPVPYSPFRCVVDGTRQLVWYDDGGPGLLVSVRELSSTEAALRVTAEGTQPMGGGEPGLTVFGTHLADRPPLGEITRLAPEYADLAAQAIGPGRR